MHSLELIPPTPFPRSRKVGREGGEKLPSLSRREPAPILRGVGGEFLNVNKLHTAFLKSACLKDFSQACPTEVQAGKLFYLHPLKIAGMTNKTVRYKVSDFETYHN